MLHMLLEETRRHMPGNNLHKDVNVRDSIKYPGSMAILALWGGLIVHLCHLRTFNIFPRAVPPHMHMLISAPSALAQSESRACACPFVVRSSGHRGERVCQNMSEISV